MKLTINGKPENIPADNVAGLIQHLGLTGRAVAVELNQEVVPKREHANTSFKEGDVVELVTLVGGG